MKRSFCNVMHLKCCIVTNLNFKHTCIRQIILKGFRGRVVKTSVSYYKVPHREAASVRILLTPIWMYEVFQFTCGRSVYSSQIRSIVYVGSFFPSKKKTYVKRCWVWRKMPNKQIILIIKGEKKIRKISCNSPFKVVTYLFVCLC
jgi:hypothetical protein